MNKYKKAIEEHYQSERAHWKKVYKDCPTWWPSFVEDRPLILWLRGQLK